MLGIVEDAFQEELGQIKMKEKKLSDGLHETKSSKQ